MKTNVEEIEKKKFKLDLLKYVKKVYPYIIIALLASSYTLYNVKKGSKNYTVTRETVDSLGNNRTYSKYDKSYTLNTGKITHVTKWELNENNEYERTTKVYDIGNLKPEIAKNVISNNETIESLDEMFGEPINSEKEIGKNLTEGELNKPEYLEVVTYSRDYDDYVVTKLSTMELIESSALSLAYFVMWTLIFGGIQIARGLNNKSIEIVDDEVKEMVKKL